MAPAAVDRALEITDAFLMIAAVIVRAARQTHAHGAGNERLADRMNPVDVGDRKVALTSVYTIVSEADATFGALVIGQHVDIAPPAIATLRPAVQIGALAAVIDHAV